MVTLLLGQIFEIHKHVEIFSDLTDLLSSNMVCERNYEYWKRMYIQNNAWPARF